jgi:hypothetical protein
MYREFNLETVNLQSMLYMSYLDILDNVNGVSFSDIDISGYKKTFIRSIHLEIGPTFLRKMVITRKENFVASLM